ncbi:MAG: tetratricopeptide repeat protein [Candidatus Omnitrophica bacterium]|nr:tetratricopeptide repeat protein [Candidatus Omnitrophota bacterium]
MALSLPVVLCLFDLFYGRKFSGRWLAEKLVHAAYIIPVAWITASLHQRRLMDNWAEAALTAVWSFVFYIRKFIYPVDLSPLYATPSPVSLENPEILFSVILFAGYAACLARYRGNRWFFFANGFFVASIFFLVRLRSSWGLHEVADRFMYLPSAGFCLLFGLGVERLFLRAGARKAANVVLAVALALLFLVLGAQTYRQTQVWENDTTLWAAVIRKGATDRLAYFARGKMYDEKGDHVNAVADYTMAITLDPQFPRAYNNRGIIYGKRGDYPRALADFNRALALYPAFAQAYNNRGLIYFYLREDRLALEDFNKAIELRPRVASSYVNRARLFQVTGQYRLAAVDFTRALQLEPGSAVIEKERAETYHALENVLR